MKPTTPCHDGRLLEQVCAFSLPRRLTEGFLQENSQEFPTVIYPEIRVITANKITQNKTYYPEASLKGSPSKATGLASFTRPYPIPVIKDHNTHGGFLGGESSDVYGRIYKKPQLVTEGNATFIKAVATLTDPGAIEKVMTGRWLTVSLGSRTESIRCSICDTELTEEWCDHYRGEKYEVKGKKVEAYWIIGPITAKELSFVLTPSDNEAGVLTPNVAEAAENQGRQECGTGEITRMLVGTERGLFDLVTGNRLQESFQLSEALPAAACGNFYFHGW